MRRAVERGEDARAVAPPDTRHMTVGRFLDAWLERIEGSLRPTTLDQYRWALRKHVIPRIDGLPLREVRDHHITTMQRELRQSGLGDHARFTVHAILGHVHIPGEWCH